MAKIGYTLYYDKAFQIDLYKQDLFSGRDLVSLSLIFSDKKIAYFLEACQNMRNHFINYPGDNFENWNFIPLLGPDLKFWESDETLLLDLKSRFLRLAQDLPFVEITRARVLRLGSGGFCGWHNEPWEAPHSNPDYTIGTINIALNSQSNAFLFFEESSYSPTSGQSFMVHFPRWHSVFHRGQNEECRYHLKVTGVIKKNTLNALCATEGMPKDKQIKTFPINSASFVHAVRPALELKGENKTTKVISGPANSLDLDWHLVNLENTDGLKVFVYGEEKDLQEKMLSWNKIKLGDFHHQPARLSHINFDIFFGWNRYCLKMNKVLNAAKPVIFTADQPASTSKIDIQY